MGEFRVKRGNSVLGTRKSGLHIRRRLGIAAAGAVKKKKTCV